MDFKSIESARRFYNAVPREQKIVLDGVYYIARNGCGPQAELEPVTVYGVPYQGE